MVLAALIIGIPWWVATSIAARFGGEHEHEPLHLIRRD
jgi:hypothetical protein